MIQIHNIQRADVPKPKKRVGRGGKRGKTCGHGHKGQKQHGRHGIRPQIRDFIKSLPKLRGHGKNRARSVNTGKPEILNVGLNDLSVFESGEIVSPASLVEKGVVGTVGGKLPKIKILANGDIKAKISVQNCALSDSARKAIENAGGEIK